VCWPAAAAGPDLAPALAADSALAGANFSGVFGERTATTAAGAALQGQLCAKHGMPACFPGHAGADTVPLGGSIHGYYLKDEPHAWDFRNWAKQAAAIRQKRPGALVFVNMLGSDRTTYEGEDVLPMRGWWGCDHSTHPGPCSYKQYVDEFIAVTQPDILCFDQYPSWGDCGATMNLNATFDTTPHFLYNLAYINNRSFEANLTYWNYFKSGFGVEVCGPSAGKVAWQMYASALHGSRGLLHFLITPCASPIDCGDIPHPPASRHLGSSRKDHGYPGILTPEGLPAPGPVYEITRRLNSVFRAWGPTLMKLRTPPGGQLYLRFADGAEGMGQKLAAARAPLLNISTGDYNIGFFFDEAKGPQASGYSAMLIQNHDAANFRFATVVFPGTSTPSGDVVRVLEVDSETGEAAPIVDAATHVAGFQIVLDAGQGRLYVLAQAKPSEEEDRELGWK
jgi:hypothetical protein